MGAAKLVPPHLLAVQVVWLAQTQKVKFAFAETSGPLRRLFEHPEQPLAVCQEGIGNPFGEMPPPLSSQTVSELHEPPALAVTRSVPPTEVT